MVSTTTRRFYQQVIQLDEMIIREATRKDAEWILHHYRGMFFASSVSEKVLDETEQMTKCYLTTDWTKDFRYFLVEVNREIIGGCGLCTFRIPPLLDQKIGLMAYLFNMYIEPQERRKGIGRALLNHIVSVCVREEIGLVILHTSEIGRYLYSKYGFTSSENLMHLRV